MCIRDSFSTAAPPRRAPAWLAVRGALDRAGLPAGFGRSWQSLFSVLHRRAPPRGATLAAVLGNYSLADLLAGVG
eukprot:4581251-Alexandrium_andersonii.AAC.1